MENKTEESKEVQIVQGKVGELQAMLESTVVENKDQLNEVSDKIKEIKTVQKFIKAEMEKTIVPAKQIITTTKDRFQPFLEKCIEVEAGLKKKGQVFMLAQKKIEDDEKAKLASKVESGYMKPETAVNRMEKVPEAKTTAKTSDSSLSMRMIKSAGAIDESKVPEDYWIPKKLDMVKINKAVKAGITVPGVEVKETPSMASR